jgi:hypothetical protein
VTPMGGPQEADGTHGQHKRCCDNHLTHISTSILVKHVHFDFPPVVESEDMAPLRCCEDAKQWNVPCHTRGLFTVLYRFTFNR